MSAPSPAHLPGRADLPLHPRRLKTKPDISSPYRAETGLEVAAMTAEGGDWFLVPVTITPGATVVPWNHPLEIDARDFPTLASRGLHSEIELDLTRTITGRSLAEITEIAQPGALSSAGFMASDETILSVLKGDNRLVAKLGLTHAQMARPLLHICNMIREDSKRKERAVRKHTVLYTILYNGRAISLDIQFTKGGQKSIFDDRLDGAWTIKIRRDLDGAETNFLNKAYAHLDKEKRDALIKKLSEMLTGEMQPFYIYRYGFYEGHTEWRADPIAIAFIFGLKSIEEIEAAFPGQLDKVLTQHFVPQEPGTGTGQRAAWSQSPLFRRRQPLRPVAHLAFPPVFLQPRQKRAVIHDTVGNSRNNGARRSSHDSVFSNPIASTSRLIRILFPIYP